MRLTWWTLIKHDWDVTEKQRHNSSTSFRGSPVYGIDESFSGRCSGANIGARKPLDNSNYQRIVEQINTEAAKLV